MARVRARVRAVLREQVRVLFEKVPTSISCAFSVCEQVVFLVNTHKHDV